MIIKKIVFFFLFSLSYFHCSSSGTLEDLFAEWHHSLINEGRVIYASEHYSVQMDCASTVAGQRLLSSRTFEEMDITWLIDNYVALDSGGADGRRIIYSVGKHRKSLLKVNDVSVGDGGLYTCNLDKGRQVENRYRTISYFVLLPTKAAVFHQYIADQFNISCPLDILYHFLSFAEADLTKWSVKWFLNNKTVREGQLINGSSLQYNVIDSVERVHEGQWRCHVEHIGHFENGKTRRVYPLKLFELRVHELPSYIIRMPSFEILRVTTPFLGLLFTLMVCGHLLMAIILFEKFATIETKFQIWQVVNKFSKKNYMKFYLKQLKDEREKLEDNFDYIGPTDNLF